MTVSLIIDNFRVHSSRLEVNYVLRNADVRDLFVYNLVSDQFEQLGKRSDVPRNQLAQAGRGQPGELVWLLGVPTAPNYGPGVMMFAPLYPHCSKVEAGHGYQAKLLAPLPLAEWTLYQGPLRSGPNVTRERVTKLRLIAEYVFADEAYHAVQELPNAWQVRSTSERHRVETSIDIAGLELELCMQADLIRFRT
jgi:hypothetical protein